MLLVFSQSLRRNLRLTVVLTLTGIALLCASVPRTIRTVSASPLSTPSPTPSPLPSPLVAFVRQIGLATNDLISDTSSATARAQAARQVAENQVLYRAESNRAFLLAQYFGYLRRNPDDPPDTDYTGYEFWLNKLNQFNGDYVAAEMVKAFISASEYRQRFGP